MRTDSRAGIDELADYLMANYGAYRQWRPTSALVADTAKARLVLKQQPHTHTSGIGPYDLFDEGWEFFLKSS